MGHSSAGDISITQIEADQLRRQFSEISPQHFQNILPSFGLVSEDINERYTF